MARAGGHSQARPRGAHPGTQHHVMKPHKHVLTIFLACVAILAIYILSLNRSDVHTNEFPSEDIYAFLAELNEQISDAGEGVSQMQLRMLRLAAGIAPERPDRATRVFSELLSSISSLGQTLPCSSSGAVQGPQNATGCAKGCFFAVNLYNSAEILPNMILQLLSVLGSLGGGVHAQRCFVSVYESGSADATPGLLDVLRQTLDLLGVPNRVVTGGDINRRQQQQQRRHQGRRWLRWGAGPWDALSGDDRISFLAELRNAALEPLVHPPPLAGATGAAAATGQPAKPPRQTDRVVFINDVFFCAADVRRLLRYDSADAACGMDFVPAALWLLSQEERQRLMANHLAGGLRVPRGWAEALSRSWLPYRIWKKLYGKSRAFWPWSFPVFYDMWVSRDVSGGRLRNRQPYSMEPWTADRLAQGLPSPVYCCWNGLVNLRAEPFLRRPPSRSTAVTADPRVDDADSSAEDGAEAGGTGSLNVDEDDYARDRRELERHAAAATTGARPLPVRFRSHRPGECAASECSLLCDDLHAAGYHRVLIEPNVRVSYQWSVALSLYDNLDKTAPEDAPGLRYRAMAQGDARQVEVSWDDDWLLRVEAGARSVECCGIQPGRQTADFDRGCAPRDMTGSWWSGEPTEEVV